MLTWDQVAAHIRGNNTAAWRCSKCGCKNNNIGGDKRINPLLFAGSKYCPNCGADMRKMDEDTEREDNK